MKGYKNSIHRVFLMCLLGNACHLAAVVPQEAELKATHKSLRGLVNTFNKYTRISQRPMTDKEWQEFTAVAKRIGIKVGVAILILSGYYYYSVFRTPASKKAQQKQMQQSEISSTSVSQEKKVNLKGALTDEEFDDLAPFEQWQHVILTGNWNRLKNIIVWHAKAPLHEIIKAAENHTNDIVEGLKQINEKYPRDINQLDENDIIPVWRAIYKLPQAENDVQADQMARAIIFLINSGANMNWKYPLSENSATIGMLAEAIKTVKAGTFEVQNMKEAIVKKFKD